MSGAESAPIRPGRDKVSFLLYNIFAGKASAEIFAVFYLPFLSVFIKKSFGGWKPYDTIPPKVPPAVQRISVVTKWEEPPPKLWFTAREIKASMAK